MKECISNRNFFIKKLHFLAKFLEPDNLSLDNILLISIVLAKSKAANPMMRFLYENENMCSMFKTRWRPTPVDLNKLESMPVNSLGHLYARHMIDNKIGAMNYDDPVESDTDYVVHRLRETHDILHALLGCGIDPEDELQTQAFCIFNLRSPLNVVLFVVLLFRLFYSGAPLDRAVATITKGAQQGLMAKCLLAFKFEDGWDRSIHQWREDLGIKT